ncbi:uncharacterized protein LOC134286474 [Aedes albopictus]|uniref:Integrase catalytic domain-containing protein n=1 Tax=Aedes albopictus TaxID=7160 RepID=A0ABM1Z399_AEDAL
MEQQQSNMLRTPPNVSNVNPHVGENVAAQPDAIPENKSVASGASREPAKSTRTRTSRSSRTDSQIKLLDLEEQNEEAELRASIERDRIVAEKQLAELQIQHDLALKTEQRKAEFLKRQRERDLRKIELQFDSSHRSGTSSRSSTYTDVSKRVADWLTESDMVRPTNVHESSHWIDRPFLQHRDAGNASPPDVWNAPPPGTWNTSAPGVQKAWNPATWNVPAPGARNASAPGMQRAVNQGAWNAPAPGLRNAPASDVRNASVQEPAVNEVLSQAFRALQGRNMRDLPPFSGDIMEWTVFENDFRTSTEEFQLSDRDNLRRLNKALHGKARKTVESLLSSPDNVEQIMRMLKSNFGRTEWVVANRLEALRNLETVKEGNIESFRAFYNAVIGTKVAMTNARADNYLMNPELISHLAEKLPAFSKQMWVRHKAALMKEGVAIEFDTFSRWLEDEMDNQLASLNPVFSVKKPSYQPKPKPTVLNVNSRDEVVAKKCPLCSASSHSGLEKCEQFRKLSVIQRRSAANSCKVCYICLKFDHARKNCKSEKKCSICKKNHHELVHTDEPARNSRISRTDAASSDDNVCNFNGKNTNTLLRVGKVKIRGPQGVAEVFALFDEGSSLSMMDAAVAESLGLRGPIAPVTYRWTNGILHKEEQSMMLSFRISGPSDQAKWYDVNNIQTVTNIALPAVKFDMARVKQLYPMLDEEKLAAIQDACPCMLIGSNNAGLIVPLKTVQYSLDGLQLTRCHLGWTIHGVVDPAGAGSSNHHAFLCSEDDDIELTDLVKQMYKVDDFGISGHSVKIADEDQRALDIMHRTITRRGDRFEVGQIYRYNNFVFPDSKPQALRRLQIMEKKMDSNPDFADRYCRKIQDYVDKGYARELEPDELTETPNTWYLPHFSVATDEKFRLVMDAKAKSHGFSLNDLLLKGPDFVPPLIAVLIRARMKKIAFVADIREMFHQVLIRREDQDSQRFLWRGMNRTDPPNEYVMQVMIFGAVSSPSMAQFIKNFNAKELEEKHPGVERAVVKQHYVDDYFDCADTEQEAIELVQRVIKVHDQGGFKLMKFSSNSRAVLASLDPEIVADKESDVRVLGIEWDLQSDEFVFPLDFPKLDQRFRTAEAVPTKRQLLKFMMGIFDPLCLLSPITIQLKIIFQELWRLQSGWDDEIPDGLVPRWMEWLNETARLGEIRLPRYYHPAVPSFSDVELHAFCDASDKAYACVIYMVHRRKERSHVALVYAKSRVAPLKSQTVPRLELQGCVLASQMISVLQTEIMIDITRLYFWTDSKICLCWLKSDQKLTAYVGARVMKIKENGHGVQFWHWVPSQLNVADLATKYSKIGSMQEWLRGPDFLYRDSSTWPVDESLEMSSEEFTSFHSEITVKDVTGPLCCAAFKENLIDLPDIARFSDFNRLIRSTAYYLKMRRLLVLPKREKPDRLTINVRDMDEARKEWYRKVQSETFESELRSLKMSGYVKSSSRLKTYSPFLHDGIIRMRGRVQDDSKPFEVNNPVILPDGHPFCTLLIRMYHIANAHQGLETVINNVKERHRILKIRSQVKKYTMSCVKCRELRAKPTVPQMGILPPARTTPHVYPFTCTGIDYFGPLSVKVGRRVEKRWVVLFTCMTSRAVHLEVVPSLDTNSCLMAIRCFMSVRGLPQCIMTDNGTNFTGADQELRTLVKSLDQPQIEESLSVRGVQWKFIPPGAPHFGGCWERLVRSVKTALGAMLRDRHPTDLVLRTALCEAMNTVNNRPLTHVADDPLDPEPLTPNMLLLGRNNVIQFDHDFDERDLDCRAAYKHSQIYADRFWRKWVAAYRPELIRSRKWPDNRRYHEYKVGDIVMLVDETLHRGNWPKGVVEKTYRGPDGKIRTVEIRTAKSRYKRPVSKVVLLQPISSSSGPENVAKKSSQAYIFTRAPQAPDVEPTVVAT